MKTMTNMQVSQVGGADAGKNYEDAVKAGMDAAITGSTAAIGGMIAGPVGAFVGGVIGAAVSGGTNDARGDVNKEIGMGLLHAGMENMA